MMLFQRRVCPGNWLHCYSQQTRENIIGYNCGTQYNKEQFSLSAWQLPQFMCCPLDERDAPHALHSRSGPLNDNTIPSRQLHHDPQRNYTTLSTSYEITLWRRNHYGLRKLWLTTCRSHPVDILNQHTTASWHCTINSLWMAFCVVTNILHTNITWQTYIS